MATSSVVASDSIVILQYHHVSDKTPKVTSVTPDTFIRHMNYLKDNGFNVISLEDAVIALRNKEDFPEKTITITFDDAYLNIYENAFPVLKKFNYPFTLFTATVPVDKRYQKFLSWNQLIEMTKFGATIANHTLEHGHSVEKLPGETNEQWLNRFQKDLEATEARIKEKTGQNIKMFAWTFGETTPELRMHLKELGYIGFGQQSGAASIHSDFTRLPRFPMAGIYGVNDFGIKVKSKALPVIAQIPDSSIITKDNLKPELELTLAGGDYQTKQVKCYATGQGELEVIWLNDEKTRLKTQAKSPLPVGRSRYNCTAPSYSG
ncbi:MAG: polysaccharide deacetylase family protein, partial [Endozoicomonas sp.]